VDGQRTSTLSFSGAQATALDNLKYIGFANYLSVWQYDNLSASVRAYGLTGGAGDWSDTNNWTGGLVASNGTAVNFSGAGGASTNNQLNSVTGLIFSNGAGSYTVSGNAVTLGAAGMANNSGNLQTVSSDLTLGTSASFTSASGALAVAGNTALGTNKLTFAATAAMTHSGAISGSGSVVKTGTGTLTLSGANTYSGGTTLSNGVLRLDHASAAGTGSITQSSGSTLEINTAGTVANAMNIYNIQTLQSVTLSGNKTLNNATYNVTNGTTTTESGTLSGSGGITKLGTGTLLVTASNTFTGTVDVQAGLLSLASATGSAAGSTTNVIVAPSATLLIAQSDQVNNAAPVTLSGGTIQRASGVSEVFGNLNVSSASFLDFGSGTEGTLSFGTYTASALLTVNNFFEGNVLTFGNNLSSSINNTNSFRFDNGFVSAWDEGTQTFTITAIPEPSTCLAAAGLLALLICSSRRRRNPAGPEAAAN
jgi:autotransporter-associated beta strand protein